MHTFHIYMSYRLIFNLSLSNQSLAEEFDPDIKRERSRYVRISKFAPSEPKALPLLSKPIWGLEP